MTVQITHKSGKVTIVECIHCNCTDTDGIISVECLPNPKGNIYLDVKSVIIIYDIKHS